jgi:hypothetical protein
MLITNIKFLSYEKVRYCRKEHSKKVLCGNENSCITMFERLPVLFCLKEKLLSCRFKKSVMRFNK